MLLKGDNVLHKFTGPLTVGNGGSDNLHNYAVILKLTVK